MEPDWLQAMREVEPAVAAQLAPHAAATALPQDMLPDAAASLAKAWLTAQVPCPNVIVSGGTAQLALLQPMLALKDTLTVYHVDPDPERLAASLNQIDCEAITEAIRAGRLVIDPGENSDASISRFVGAVDFSRVPRIRLLDAVPLDDADYEMLVERTRGARELIRFQACDLATRLRFGEAWQMQTIRNLPEIVRHTGVKQLFGAFAGKPALVIAAGPSLTDVVPYIARHRHRIVVVCVGRVLTHLVYRAGIMPDLVVTGDGQDYVVKHFDRKPPLVPVVASSFTEPSLVERLDRTFFMELESMNLPKWLRSKVGELGEVYPGGNVSTAAMAVAEVMGCNPILTAGLDLSYPEDGKMHVAGRSMAELEEDPEYTMSQRYEVPGNHQALVTTNRQMMHYIDFTGAFVKKYPDTTFVNLNTAGARIDGMVLEAPSALDGYLGGPVNAASRIARLYGAGTGDPTAVGRCRASLEEDLPRLQSLQRECLDAAMLCNQLIMLVRRPQSVADPEKTLHGYLAQLNPLDERIQTDPVMDLIEARIEGASHMLSERMLRSEERAMHPAVRSHLRWRRFYTAVADACRETETLLTEVMDRFATAA